GVRGEREFIGFSAAKNAEQRIVVFGRDGIELVVVALSASHGQSKKSAGRSVYSIILKFRTESIKAQAGRQFLATLALHKIARKLGCHEPIVGHVFVKSLDHPVPVAKRVWVGI